MNWNNTDIWNDTNLTKKITYLKELMHNCADGTFDAQDFHIVNALVVGSANKHTHEDLRFDMNKSHINFLKYTWDTAIDNQINNSIINSVRGNLCNNSPNADTQRKSND
jgi:hypothetical protein